MSLSRQVSREDFLCCEKVKSPEVGKEKKAFGNKPVAGQIWSYLHAMKAQGHPCPIGAIMTYDKIAPSLHLETTLRTKRGERM